jgi:hypothetical protein
VLLSPKERRGSEQEIVAEVKLIDKLLSRKGCRNVEETVVL